ncbi:MAG: CysB family HTH-type transcriptional regulator [Piscirickettsiaceae bacterium]|nr:CysB family HTH-type transcriptional regulator [Piscirickettsiaceae bacterium]
MQLHQLRYIREIARQGFSVSAAAKALGTSQPNVSNQVQQLEEELGLKIFERYGKRLTGLSAVGNPIIELANNALINVDNINQLVSDNHNDQMGTLSIGTTHTQARYALPKAIKSFSEHYPNVHLNMVQGTPVELAEMAAAGQIDIAIATEGISQNTSLFSFPCYDWNRTVVVPENHPLLSEKKLTLEAIAQYPILTYTRDITGRALQDKAFKEHNLKPHIIFTATDADVIKTYVELEIELGVGIIASMAFNQTKDAPLIGLDASHLFSPSTTVLGFRRNSYLRKYTYAFIEFFAPHLTRNVIDESIKS